MFCGKFNNVGAAEAAKGRCVARALLEQHHPGAFRRSSVECYRRTATCAFTQNRDEAILKIRASVTRCSDRASYSDTFCDFERLHGE